ncbi:TraX family protein [Stenotrophomonas acidaminiphila]|uniref:TraX family protein n=1 Tax=Stenotrophomonas acidaminiphila TaxID=128780 RepID=UPI00289CE64C|nr:TraX family protein [Stenotrophomonas acidaminiphila]
MIDPPFRTMFDTTTPTGSREIDGAHPTISTCASAISPLMQCAWNGNGWALLAFLVLGLALANISVPRTRWAFYGYYVGHLALLASIATILLP